MRFGALSALAVLGASLAASGSPIRVVVTEVSSVRYGHAAVDPNSNLGSLSHPPVDTLFAASAFAQPVTPAEGDKPSHGRHFCASVRAKALDASNALRQWLGLEPIRVEAIRVDHRRPEHMHHIHHAGGPVSQGVSIKDGKTDQNPNLPILPFVGTPVRPAFAEGEGGWPDRHHGGPGRRPMWVHHHGGHRMHGSFLRRVHHALMALGPWEGRAVAFVLGCGIGVLLRMVWVMVLVTARAFRGSREEESEYDVVFDEAEAEMLVPPPQYTIIEGAEAVPVPIDEKADKA